MSDETVALNAYQRGIKGIQRPDDGVWAAVYPDESGVVIHETEIDALRAAAGSSMEVVFWPFGLSLREVRS